MNTRRSTPNAQRPRGVKSAAGPSRSLPAQSMSGVGLLALSRLLSPRHFLVLVFSLQPIAFSLLLADTHYVDIASTNPTPPYTNWATAATVIQDAVDAATNGDTVLVADGVYDVGAVTNCPAGTTLSNRVAVTKPMAVRSVNGPRLTAIQGSGPRGDAACRCAYVASNALLAGFTITNGNTKTEGDDYAERSGGGVWCESPLAVVSNCQIVGNAAANVGGGSYQGRFVNCGFAANSAYVSGGGAYGGSLRNCTVLNNFAGFEGGGTRSCSLYNSTVAGNRCHYRAGGSCLGSLYNSIIYYNTAPLGENHALATLRYCCTTPPSGEGCVAEEPGIVAIDNPHLLPTSRCIDAGTNDYAAGAADLDGESRTNGVVDIGVDEVWPAGLTNAFTVGIRASATQAAPGQSIEFEPAIVGAVQGYKWSLEGGVEYEDALTVTRCYAREGVYRVSLEASNLAAMATVTQCVVIATPPTIYVSQSGHDGDAGTNWATAKLTIQAGVDAQSIPGGRILVGPGLYSTGGRVTPDCTLSNRVLIAKPVMLESIAGPDSTVIEGGSACRCVYLGKGASISGYTLRGGRTFVGGWSISEPDRSGGGAWCDAASATLSNCLLTGSSATDGGGVRGGTLSMCSVVGNVAATWGGGSYFSVLKNSLLRGNSASFGGAAAWGALNGCVLVSNAATNTDGDGGATIESDLDNCTVADNSAEKRGGGVHGGTLRNCIVYHNLAPTNANHVAATMLHCCTLPDPSPTNGNLVAPPLFVDRASGDYRLQVLSPCVDSGINQSWMSEAVDLAGRPRILNGVVDIGAYETPFLLRVRLWLQGAYVATGHGMAAGGLNSTPSVSPYADRSCMAGLFPSGAVDWLLVELAESKGVALATRSAPIDASGRLVSADGSEGITVEVSAGAYPVAVKHRNHLAAVSAHPVQFTNLLVAYDFTTGPDKYLGGTNACVELEPGVWGMIAGDADGDGKITWVDREIVEQQRGMTGYLSGDLNLDGVVDGGD